MAWRILLVRVVVVDVVDCDVTFVGMRQMRIAATTTEKMKEEERDIGFEDIFEILCFLVF